MAELLNNSVGDRIIYCRSSLQLTRKELVEAWSEVSLPTLVRWELGTGKITEKKIPSLIHYFNQNGLIVTESWILHGSGSPPILMGEHAFETLDFDSLVQENLLILNKKIKNFVFGQVKNNLLSPCIKYGDYIGGSDVSLSILGSLVGEMMFLRQNNGLSAGILETDGEQVILRSIDRISQECFNKKSIEFAGKIQWIARRL